MSEKPTYEELEKRIQELEQAESERNRTEEALQESEKKFRSMMEAMADETYICSSDFRIEYMNPAMIEMVGHDAIGEYCCQAIYGRYEQCAWCIHGKIMKGERVDYEFHNPVNNEIHLISNSPIFNTDGSISKLSIFRNISKIKKAEKALRESEERFRVLFEQSPFAIWISDAKGTLQHANEAGVKLIGAKSEDFLGKSFLPLFTKHSQAIAADVYSKSMAGIDVGQYELEFAVTGKICQFKNGLLYEGKNIKGVFGAMRDVTKQKRAEEALWESNERFQKVFDSQLDAIFVLNAAAPPLVLLCNKAASDIFGYGPDEMTGEITGKLHVDKSHLKVFQERLLTAIEKKGVLKNFEFSMRRKNGEVFPSEHTVLQLKNDVGKRTGWVSIVRDLTERKRTENRLQRLQKMEAIGQLAGGVAHDLNNVLSGIVSYPEIVVEDIKEWREREESLITQLMVLEGCIETDLARNPDRIRNFVNRIKQGAENESKDRRRGLCCFKSLR